MEKILIFIKHHFVFLWNIIEWINGMIFSLLHTSKLRKILTGVFIEFTGSPFVFRKLNPQDAESLYNLLNSQNPSDLDFFHPHNFDYNSIVRQFKKPSFLMMGAFENEKLIGYFFLRFFSNRKCFVGRLIDKEFRGKSIGLVMNKIMYETAWRMNFRCLSTISRNNSSVMKAHARNQTMVVLKELHNDYLLVEFTRAGKQ
jgi:hypothetical protein